MRNRNDNGAFIIKKKKKKKYYNNNFFEMLFRAVCYSSYRSLRNCFSVFLVSHLE